MKTVLVTGGTDGIGKGMVLSYLAKGYHVFAVGTSENKGNALIEEAEKLGSGKVTFLKANLSLVEENRRVAKIVSEQVETLDALVLCAASLKAQPSYIETKEEIEFTFALYYLSRYILCYELKEMLEKAENPIIINVAAPGMKGPVYWDDLQMKENYDGQKAQFHGSRLNDLLGVWFCEKDLSKKIKYILFNPMAARTSGAKKMAGESGFMKVMMNFYYKFMGKDVDEIVDIINSDIEKTVKTGLSAYKLDQQVDLSMDTFELSNAEKLNRYTENLLN
ncbi:MAG: SDR family NAD(P)-dependent oxidoreductase [Lachnospiraceae bacterium]|nr:SDR family NAD(P)-dependent oxidoreductase [Lachnospiraceae bacterium]